MEINYINILLGGNMMAKTLTNIKNWFNILDIKNVTIKFTGKTITINDRNFRIPAPSKDYDSSRHIKFEQKIIEYVQSLLSEEMIEEITKKYEVLLNDLKSQNIRVDFTYVNYGVTAARDIKKDIENAKRLIKYTESQPNFYKIIEKYEAYRNLMEHDWAYITTE